MGRNHENQIVSEIAPVYENTNWRLKNHRVGVYARVSTDSCDQENSLENQKRYYEDFVRANPNWVYVDLYADDGVSGTSTHNRHEFNRLIKDCKEGKVDLILVKDVPRFARNVGDCVRTVELLLALDPPVGVYFENHNLNTLDVGSNLFLGVYAVFAETESGMKSQSVKFGNRARFEKGDYFCPVNLLGYKKDGKYGMKIEPEGAKTVRLIYDLFLAGYSKKKIAEVLTSLSRPTASGKRKWSPEGVSGILKNEKYCGDFVMQKSFVENFKTHKAIRNKGQRNLYYEPGHHDGIVSREKHERALRLLKSDRTSPYFDHRFVIRVIRQGLLSGFIPMNPAFGGYDASHYLYALKVAEVPFPEIEAEVAHIAGTKRIRRELLCDRYAAAVTFSEHGLHFNTGCVSLMDGIAFVEVLLHPAERLLAVRQIASKDRRAVPWKALPVRARELSHIIYQLMGWKKDWKYKTTAHCFSKKDEQVIFFDLGSCWIQFRENEKSINGIPSDWISCFGENLPGHMICRRALAEKLKNWDLSIPASQVEGFELGMTPLTKEQAKKRINEMRSDHEKEK